MKNGYFNVAPRFTAGSPALVSEQIARQVVKEERDGFDRALEGFHGHEEQLRAQSLGLAGIVEYRIERARGWLVEDLCTGDRFYRPFDPTRKQTQAERAQAQSWAYAARSMAFLLLWLIVGCGGASPTAPTIHAADIDPPLQVAPPVSDYLDADDLLGLRDQAGNLILDLDLNQWAVVCNARFVRDPGPEFWRKCRDLGYLSRREER